MNKGALGYLLKPTDEEHINNALTEMLVKQKPLKQVLIAQGDSLTAKIIKSIVKDTDIKIKKGKTFKTMEGYLKNGEATLLILDYQQKEMTGLEYCEKVRRLNPKLSIIVYSGIEIDEDEISKLGKFTDSIIMAAPQADQRIIQDIRHFLGNLSRTKANLQGEIITGQAHGGAVLLDKKILVVDDDARNLFVITSALEQQSAHVVTALNGKKAIEILHSQPMDLVFMDIMMPEMNGFEAIQRIRSDKKIASIPIVALTANALRGDRELSLAAGCDGYIQKPLNVDMLPSQMMAFLRRTR